jgi:hypothetical protein
MKPFADARSEERSVGMAAPGAKRPVMPNNISRLIAAVA